MIGYVQSLDRLGFPLGKEFAINIILNSLPSVYGSFIMNYHMHGMDKKAHQINGMLKTAEADTKRGTNQVLMVRKNSKIKKISCLKKAKSRGGSASDSLQAPPE
jgi:hypothetical protein